MKPLGLELKNKIKESKLRKPDKRIQDYGRKGILILLIVMLLFTVISRLTASFTIAKVTVEQPSARKIEHTVEATGTVEKNRELAVITQPDILVKTVYVNVGQKVQQGDLLAELDIEDLEEGISRLENEIQILKLQNQAIGNNAALSAQERQKQINRAQEDYNKAVQDNDDMIAKAAADLQSAQDALAAFGQNPPPEDDTEGAEGAGNTKNEETLEGLTAAVTAAQTAYDNAVKAKNTALSDAARRLEDANTAESSDNSISINNISIAQKEKQLEKLSSLKQQEGKLIAPAAGVVTEVYLMTGQKTGNTAALTLADISSGMRYSAEIGKEDAKYVSVGAEVELSVNSGGKTATVGKKISDLTIHSLEANEDGQTLTVTIMLPPDSLSIGDVAVMKVIKQSDRHEITVPMTAIREEYGKYYLYLLTQVDTVLGKQYAAQRMDVEIEDKNSQYAALKNSAITSEDMIIVDSDRYITAGDRVRLQTL